MPLMICYVYVHVIWECPAYKDKREGFMVKLRAILGEAFKYFEALGNIEKVSFVLGCELWTENFDGSACFSEGVHNRFVGG